MRHVHFGIIAATLGILVWFPTFTPVRAETLSIPPVTQRTHVWCWIAVIEMVARYHDVPNVNPAGVYQCGIVGLLALGGSSNQCAYECRLCTVPAGSAQNLGVALEEYPRRARVVTGRLVRDIVGDYQSRPLDPDEIVEEIDDENPIIAGISPSGRPPQFTSEHVALIVGYERDGDILIVNDPYPFPPSVWADPYLAAGAREVIAGRYRIRYDTFVERLQWKETITTSSVGRRRPSSLPSYCCTNLGRLGPYPNTSVPPGGPCHGTLPNGVPATGRACY